MFSVVRVCRFLITNYIIINLQKLADGNKNNNWFGFFSVEQLTMKKSVPKKNLKFYFLFFLSLEHIVLVRMSGLLRAKRRKNIWLVHRHHHIDIQTIFWIKKNQNPNINFNFETKSFWGIIIKWALCIYIYMYAKLSWKSTGFPRYSLTTCRLAFLKKIWNK